MKHGITLPFDTVRIDPLAFHVVPSTTNQQVDCSTFEFDRLLVIRSLEGLSREIEHAAIDLALVAAERVFGAEVSAQLLEESRKLRSSVRDLKRLRSSVAQADSYQAGQKGS
jgi:hypothetical protein